MITVIVCPDSTYASHLALMGVRKDFPERNENNFISFNMQVTTPKEVAEEADFLSIGIERKAIVAENCTFLQKPVRGQKKVQYEGIEELTDYCNNPADFTDLYFTVYGDKLDDKSPLVAAIKKNGRIQFEKAPDEALLRKKMEVFLSRRGCSILEPAAKELLSRAGDNYAHFANEIRKLSIYAGNEPITLDMVKMLVVRPLDDNAFALSDALLSNNVEKAFSIYEDLKMHGQDEVALIGLLSTSFRFLDQVAYLDSMNKSRREIAMILGVEEWRVGKRLQSIYGKNIESIAVVLERLYETAKTILTGNATPEFAFGRFLANFSLS
ncbi:MAG: DNA polymerase III subunit delta [Bacilli bacterium]|nr:DNA polymerase III subunit delta [Bacilli bacterium]